MVAVTYGFARGADTVAKDASGRTTAPRKSWLARFYDALIAARMQSARREIALHAHLIPPEFREQFYGQRTKRGSDDMPSGGW